MPEMRSADWSKVRLKCAVMMLPEPLTLRVQIELRDIEFDEELMHWDSLGGRICALVGKQISMRADQLPKEFCRINSTFWISHDNAIVRYPAKRYFFRAEADEVPVVTVTTEPWEW